VDKEYKDINSSFGENEGDKADDAFIEFWRNTCKDEDGDEHSNESTGWYLKIWKHDDNCKEECLLRWDWNNEWLIICVKVEESESWGNSENKQDTKLLVKHSGDVNDTDAEDAG
jgi:hypothetical protein